MKYKILGVICPKNWKNIGKKGKVFTIVINTMMLSELDVITINGKTLIVYKVCDFTDNGRKYKVHGEEGNAKGFEIKELKGYKFDLLNIQLSKKSLEANHQSDNTEEQTSPGETMLNKIKKWFQI